MSVFFTSSQEAQQAREDALFSLAEEQPPFLDLGEVGRGAARGLVGLASQVNRAGELFANLPNTALETPSYLLPQDPVRRAATRRFTDPHFGERTDLAEYFQRSVDFDQRVLDTLRPVRAQSQATQIISGLAEVMAPAVVGGFGGAGGGASALAASTNENAYRQLIEQGVDEETARSAALQQAGFMAAMGAAPIAFGGAGKTLLVRMLQRGASGAAINLAFGAAMRGNMHDYLTAQGYGADSQNNLADQYKWLDPQAATIDALMGAFFGSGALDVAARASARAFAGARRAVSAALIEADTINRQTAFGIPENQASRRWQSEALTRMEEQAARDEEIDPGPVPEDVGFVPLPDEADAHMDAAMRAFEEEAQSRGLAEMAAELRRLREERPDAFGPDDMLFSMRRIRVEGGEKGDEPFHDDRLTPDQGYAVKRARDGLTNNEIAEEMETTSGVVAVHLAKAKQRIPGLEIPPSRMGANLGRYHGKPTATIEEIVRLRNYLSARGFTNPVGQPKLGVKTLNQVIAARLHISTKSVASRISHYERDVRDGKRPPIEDARPLHSVNENGGFSTVADLQAYARREFGLDWEALQRAGYVEIVQHSSEVPTGLLGLPRGVQGVHVTEVGKSFFVANNIRPADLKGIILHEVGVHHGMEQMLGERGWNEMLRQVRRMVRDEHPQMVEAYDIAKRYAAENIRDEETIAYLVEMHADSPLVQKFLSRIRQRLIKTFGSTFGMRLTVDDIRSLAITSLRRLAEQARREAGDVVEIAPPLPASEALDAGGAGGERVGLPAEDAPLSPDLQELGYRRMEDGTIWDGYVMPPADQLNAMNGGYENVSRNLALGRRTRAEQSELRELFAADDVRELTQAERGRKAELEQWGVWLNDTELDRLEFDTRLDGQFAGSRKHRRSATQREQDNLTPRPSLAPQLPAPRAPDGGVALEGTSFTNAELSPSIRATIDEVFGEGAAARALEDKSGDGMMELAEIMLARGETAQQQAAVASMEEWAKAQRAASTSRALRNVTPREAPNGGEWDGELKQSMGRGLGTNRLRLGDVEKPQFVATLQGISEPSVVKWREHVMRPGKSGGRPAVAIRIVELSYSKTKAGEFLNPTEIAAQMQREGFFKGNTVREAADLVDVRRSLLRAGNAKSTNPAPAVTFPELTQREPTPTRAQERFWARRAALDADAYQLFAEGDGQPVHRRGGPRTGPRAVGKGWTLQMIADRQGRSITDVHKGVKRHEARLGDIEAERIEAERLAPLAEFKMPTMPRLNYDARDIVLMFNEGLTDGEMAVELELAGAEDVKSESIAVQSTRIRQAIRRAESAGGVERLAGAMDITLDQLTAFLDAGKRRAKSIRGEARRLIASGVTDNRTVIRHLKEWIEENRIESTNPDSLEATVSIARKEAGISRTKVNTASTPEQRAEVIRLRQEGVGQTEIAERLGISQSAVLGAITRARAAGAEFPALTHRRSDEGLFGKSADDELGTPRLSPARGGDDPLFSMGGRGQNRENLLRDRVESPAFQNKIRAVEERLARDGILTRDALGRKSADRSSVSDQRGRDGSGKGEGAAGREGRGRGDSQAGAGGLKIPREIVRDILSISGLKLERDSGDTFGKYRASIDLPHDLDPEYARAFQAGTDKLQTQVRFDLKEGPNKRILLRWSNTHPSLRGTGAGKWLYRQTIDWALDNGYDVYSDFSVSERAQRVYQALERQGYVLARNARATLKENGTLSTKDLTPVYRVRRGDTAEILDAAPPPRGGYQIDGPTLKERMAPLIEARKRQEEYDALSPAEQELRDNPNMKFSVGPRKVAAQDVRDMAAREREAADEMRKGFEAAARCAARNASSGVARASLITLGWTPAAAADAALGQVLGLAAAVPIGITVTPFIARAGRSENYAPNGLRRVRPDLLGSHDERFPVVDPGPQPELTDPDYSAPGRNDWEAPDEFADNTNPPKPGQAVPELGPLSDKPQPEDNGAELTDLMRQFIGKDDKEQ